MLIDRRPDLKPTTAAATRAAVAFLLLATSFWTLSEKTALATVQSSAGRSPAHAAPDADWFARTAESHEWKRLLHYQPRALFWEESNIDNPEFFLAPNGARDPAAGLRATWNALTDPSAQASLGALKLSPACAFPARRAFLEKISGFSFPESPCADFLEWKSGLNARSVSLVFSSAFAGSPGSLFGHTFLKFSPKSAQELSRLTTFTPEELSDHTLSYAAETGEVNPLTYFAYGLGGGFKGLYALAPFYMKVREYNHTEGRDLWIYDLALTEQQVSTLLDHLWELITVGGNRYYFFDENCASVLLELLDVARPDWSLRRTFFYQVLPVEILRRVENTPQAIVNTRARASHDRELSALLSSLSEEEQAHFDKLIDTKERNVPSDLFDNAGRQTLLAVVSYFDWLRVKEKGQLGAAEGKMRRRSLLALAQTPAHGPDTQSLASSSLTTRSDPRLSALPTVLSVGWRTPLGPKNRWKSRGAATLGLRPGYRRLIDPTDGALSGLEIEYLTAEMSTDPQTGSFWLSGFTPVNVAAFRPLERHDPSLSYTVTLSYTDWEKPRAALRVGVGSSWATDSGKNNTLHLLAQSLFQNHWSPAARFGIVQDEMPKATGLTQPGASVLVGLEAGYTGALLTATLGRIQMLVRSHSLLFKEPQAQAGRTDLRSLAPPDQSLHAVGAHQISVTKNLSLAIEAGFPLWASGGRAASAAEPRHLQVALRSSW